MTAAGPPPPILTTSREALARQILSRMRARVEAMEAEAQGARLELQALEATLGHAPISALVGLVDVQVGGDARVRLQP